MRKSVTGLLAMAALVGVAQTPVSPGSEMLAHFGRFFDALAPEQRSQAGFGLEDGERLNFHYTPVERKGVPFKAMTPAQRKLAHALLTTGLSPRGYRQASEIMYLEQILWEMENQSPRRDPDLYFFTVFGEPSRDQFWGWRFEGHHLSLNFTLNGDSLISASPAFFGANPATVRSGPMKGLRVLEKEETLARELLLSLPERIRRKAILSTEAPNDILTQNRPEAHLESFAGVSISEFDESQRRKFHALVALYAHRLRPELAERELERIRNAGLDKIYFSWAGDSSPGKPHYYRVHGPHFVVEYDNTQNDANHIHSVWRDFEKDFGRDLLGDHYRERPHN